MKSSQTGNLCCFCFRSKKVCISFFIVFLSVLGTFCYFLFPSLPEVHISSIYDLNHLNTSEHLTLSNLNNFASNNFTSFPYAVNVSVYSPSYIKLGIRKIDILLELKDLRGRPIPNFFGNGTVEGLQFPPRSRVEFVYPIMIIYQNPDQSVLDMLIFKCLHEKKIQLKATIKIEIDAFSLIGIIPSYKTDQYCDCPPMNNLMDFY